MTVLAAAQATVNDLVTAVCARMREVAEGFGGLKAKDGTARAPEVHAGWLPPKTSESKQFPFLIVLPAEGEDSAEGADQNATATLHILIGTYSDDDEGVRDPLLVLDAIRLSLHQRPHLGGALEHVGPLKWGVPDDADRYRPQWVIRVITRFSLPRPARALAQEV